MKYYFNHYKSSLNKHLIKAFFLCVRWLVVNLWIRRGEKCQSPEENKGSGLEQRLISTAARLTDGVRGPYFTSSIFHSWILQTISCFLFVLHLSLHNFLCHVSAFCCCSDFVLSALICKITERRKSSIHQHRLQPWQHFRRADFQDLWSAHILPAWRKIEKWVQILLSCKFSEYVSCTSGQFSLKSLC